MPCRRRLFESGVPTFLEWRDFTNTAEHQPDDDIYTNEARLGMSNLFSAFVFWSIMALCATARFSWELAMMSRMLQAFYGAMLKMLMSLGIAMQG